MKRMLKLGLWRSVGAAALVGVLVAGTTWAAGLYTNGVPTVCAPLQNGANATTVPASGTSISTPAATAPSNNCSQTQVNGGWFAPVDTNLTQGIAPQTVALQLSQIASLAAEYAANAGTSTAGAATLNTNAGTVTTESLSTAVGATYTFTLTNSQITATGPTPVVQMLSKTNTGGQTTPSGGPVYTLGGPMTLASVTNAAGSSVFKFTNNGATALNGTTVITFWLGD
jgi:hypothetical protein